MLLECTFSSVVIISICSTQSGEGMTYAVDELVLDLVLALVSNTTQLDISLLPETMHGVDDLKLGRDLLFTLDVHVDWNRVVNVDKELGVEGAETVGCLARAGKVDFDILVALVATDEVTDAVASATGVDEVGRELDVDVGIPVTAAVGAGGDVGVNVEFEGRFVTLLIVATREGCLKSISRSCCDLSDTCEGRDAEREAIEEMHLEMKRESCLEENVSMS